MQGIDRVREDITEVICNYHTNAYLAYNGKIKHYPSIVEAQNKILSIKIGGTTLKELLEKLEQGGELRVIDKKKEVVVPRWFYETLSDALKIKHWAEKKYGHGGVDEIIKEAKLDVMEEAILRRQDLENRKLKK